MIKLIILKRSTKEIYIIGMRIMSMYYIYMSSRLLNLLITNIYTFNTYTFYLKGYIYV